MQVFLLGCLALALCAVATGQRTAPATAEPEIVDDVEITTSPAGAENTTEVYTTIQQTELASTIATQGTTNGGDIKVSIKLEKYSNPDNLLISGSNCDPFGWSKCDPYLTILYNTNDNLILRNLTSNTIGDVDSVEYGLFIGFLNPITLQAPVGTVVNLQVTVHDDDYGRDELIGVFPFSYVAGSPSKTETKKSGSTQFTVSFY